jgi:hypothetical protein
MRAKTSTHHAFPVFGLFFGYLGSAILGALIAFAYLVSLQPTAIDTAGKTRTEIEGGIQDSGQQLKTRVHYYKTSSLGHAAQALARRFYASRTNRIEVTAMELNAWAAANLSPAKLDGDGKTPILTLSPQVPTFQIAQKQLHIAYPFQVSIWGWSASILLLCSGDFANTAAGPDWQVNKLYFNSAPLPFKQELYKLAMPHIQKALNRNEEAKQMQAAWSMVRSIQVGDVTLLVDRR